jgi:diguanylate cyclase (GGDEF)-like protein/PAS domain S-box-containing protein
MNKNNLLISMIKIIFLVLIAITAFEYAKYMIFPGLTVLYSHIIGITVGVIIIGVTAYMVQKKQEQLWIEKIAETERRMQSEASLRNVEERYRRLFIDSMDGVCHTTLDGNIVEANQAFCDIFGCDADQIIGGSITQFYSNPEDRIKFRNVIEKNKGVKNYELIQKRKNGQQIICSVSSSYCYSRQGELDGYLTIVRDITDHNRVEEALRESRARLDLALQSADMGMWDWDIIENKRYFDDQVCHLLGINPSTFTGTAEEFIGAIHPDDLELLQATMVRTIEQGVLYEPEYRAVWPDGSIHYITARGRLVRDDLDRPIRVSGIIWDISERKRAEEAFHEQLNFVQQLLDAIPIPIFYKDRQGIFCGCNNSYEKFVGMAKEQVVGKTVFEIAPHDLATVYKQADEALFNQQGTQIYETSFLHADGNKHDIIFNKATYVNKRGSVAGLVGVILDITERKRAEEALRESEGRFRALVEQAAVGVAEIDMNTGRFLTVNQRLCEMMGRTITEMLATTFQAITHPADLHRHEGKTQMMLAGEIHHYSLEKRYLRKDGESVWVNITVSPLWKPGEVPGRNIAVVEDITDRKRMEEEILALSITDQLTGLHNRRGFLSLADQQLKLAERNKSGMLLFFADLDGLKWINDTLGHEEGDRALIEVATVLKATFRTSDIIARLGGDEYAALAVDITEDNYEIFTERLQSLIDTQNHQENRRYRISISIGCACYDPENPRSIDELMASADKLMYEQKQKKKDLLLQRASLSNGNPQS